MIDFWKADELEITKELIKMYRKVYWSQIFSFKTAWSIKWIAIKSLWIMRKIKED